SAAGATAPYAPSAAPRRRLLYSKTCQACFPERKGTPLPQTRLDESLSRPLHAHLAPGAGGEPPAAVYSRSLTWRAALPRPAGLTVTPPAGAGGDGHLAVADLQLRRDRPHRRGGRPKDGGPGERSPGPRPPPTGRPWMSAARP